MDLNERLDVFINLGQHLRAYLKLNARDINSNEFNELDGVLDRAYINNGWFTKENSLNMLDLIARQLNPESLRQWIYGYDIKQVKPQSIGIIMAGNIPLVGFNDLLCVLMSGHVAVVKLSSDDEVLPRYIINFLLKQNPALIDFITISDSRLKGIDAVIATGSNNSARYFNYYFGKYPHIIRKNRHSIAVLNGTEDANDLFELGKDIFTYFGLGCRNISKLYVPHNYNFNLFFESIVQFGDVVNNKKYGNNYDYNRAVYLLNNEKFLDNNFLIVKEGISFATPVSVLHYEYYTHVEEVEEKIKLEQDILQCIVSKNAWFKNSLALGTGQYPALTDYADGVDTMQFLVDLN
jgi:hypothetical protein